MLRYIFIAISISITTLSWAQDTLTLSGANTITTLAVDVKGNRYLSDNSLTLYKYDKTGKLITNVNIKSYGEITSIDCSNAFELYVYHRDQNIVVFYDNMLNQRGELRLNDYYFNNVACIARSFDNNIWIVDLSQYKLIKINKLGEKLSESPYLNNILGRDLNIFKMWEENNDVYLVDSLVGIHQFDMYATFKTTYYLGGIADAVGIGDRMLMLRNGSLYTYNKLIRNPIKLSQLLPNPCSFGYYNNELIFSYKNSLITSTLD